jgi:hypothetical protein
VSICLGFRSINSAVHSADMGLGRGSRDGEKSMFELIEIIGISINVKLNSFSVPNSNGGQIK